MNANQIAYDESRNVFRAASAAFRKINEDYRALKIGDNEFLAGKKAFAKAQEAADVAEELYVANYVEEPEIVEEVENKQIDLS